MPLTVGPQCYQAFSWRGHGMSTSAQSVHEMTTHTYALTTEAHVGVALSGRLAPVRRSSMLRALTGMWIVSVGGVCGMCLHQGWLKLDAMPRELFVSNWFRTGHSMHPGASCLAKSAVCECLCRQGAGHADSSWLIPSLLFVDAVAARSRPPRLRLAAMPRDRASALISCSAASFTLSHTSLNCRDAYSCQ